MITASTNLQVIPEWHPHFDVWLLVVLLFGLYFLAVQRHRVSSNESPTRRQIASYVCGVSVLWLASDYPIHDLAERYLFSAHMLQHLLITLVAPPLMICGLPDWMLRSLFCRPRIKVVAKFLFTPIVAAVLYNVATVFTHWPVVVNAALNYHWLHLLVHIGLFCAAWAMWMPVFNQLPELPSIRMPMKLVYLFLQSVIPTVPAAFITFAERPIYDFYAQSPRIWSTFSAVEDQQTAGAIMKVIGGGFLWAFIIVLFFRWNDEEDAPNNPADKKASERGSIQSVVAGGAESLKLG